MRVISAEVFNFASYKHLKFSFDDKGLCLIEGANGSGKSTLCDIVPWILFGKTAKGGAVDEIISWNADGPTVGSLYILTHKMIKITRIRASKGNDLYYSYPPDFVQHRGKDLADTQRQINNLAGIDLETYSAGSYFHEFSKTATFFTKDAKDRKAICDLIIDQTTAKKIQTKIAEDTKEVNNQLKEVSSKFAVYKSQIPQIEQRVVNAKHNHDKYEKQRKIDLIQLQAKCDSFDEDKQNGLHKLVSMQERFEADKTMQFIRIDDEYRPAHAKLSLVKKSILDLRLLTSGHNCSECGAPKHHDKLKYLADAENELKNIENQLVRLSDEQKKLGRTINPYDAQIDRELTSINTYSKQIVDLKKAVNPYDKVVLTHCTELNETKDLIEHLNDKINKLNTESADLDLASDVIDTFRSVIIRDAINQLQDATNQKLSIYFDAELRVMFDVTDKDKFEVEIYKDGNICSYTQLSKGQRQMLKLCFATSVMPAVANQHGISFNALMLDESLDGMSDDTKAKAIRLFESLSLIYSSVFVVEHSEKIKALFNSKLSVSLNSQGESIVKEET